MSGVMDVVIAGGVVRPSDGGIVGEAAADFFSQFKVDYAIEGDIPWTNEDCRRAGTLHLGGSSREIAATEGRNVT